MHYANRLKEENNALRSIIGKRDQKLADFIAYLQTASKFQGTDSDGSRKDWISTADVIKALQKARGFSSE